MKKTDFAEIKKLDIKGLNAKVATLKTELGDLELDKNMKKLKDLKMIFKTKKTLAQVLTLINQKEFIAKLEQAKTLKEAK